MANEQDIIVRIREEGLKELTKSLDKAAKASEDVSEGVDEINKKSDTLASGFKKVGAAAAAAFATAQIADFIKESVRLADIQLKAEAQLLKALRGRQDIQSRLIRQAKDLQKVTIFGDEEIIQQQAFLAGLGLTEKQIKKVIKAATDLSAGVNISLESSVRNLAKTYSGLSGELGELVTPLRDLTQEQLKNGEAVDLVTKLYEGQAEVLRNTGAGAVTGLQNAFGDLREELGRGVLEGLQPFAETLQDISEDQDVIDFFTGLGKVLGKTLEVVSQSIQGWSRLFGILRGNSTRDVAFAKELEQSSERSLMFLQNRLELERDSLSGRAAPSQRAALNEQIELIKQRRAELAGERTQIEEAVSIEVEKTEQVKEQKNVKQEILDIEKRTMSIKEESIRASLAEIREQKQLIKDLTAGGLETGAFDAVVAQLEAQEKALADSLEREAALKEQAAIEDEQRRQAGLSSSIDAARTAFTVASGFIENRQALLEQQFKAGEISEKEYNARRSELQRKQAVANKANAVFEIGLNTATAITSALKAGPIVGPILAGVVTALAAAQLAQVLSAPIPQFAKGTKGRKKAPKGFAWVGEEGPELVQMKGGENVITAGDSERLSDLLSPYGIKTQYKAPSIPSLGDGIAQLISMRQLIPDDEARALFTGVDFSPLVRSSDMNRLTLGKKLDRIHHAIVASNNRPMTRA